MTDPDDTLAKILEEISKANKISGNCCCCKHCNNCWWKYPQYPGWIPNPNWYPYGPVYYTNNTAL